MVVDRNRTRLLIVSFSQIHRDARVLRQIELFEDEYELTVCGFGPAPSAAVEYLEVKGPVRSWDGRLLALGLYRWTLWTRPGIREALRKLRGRTFDLVLADEEIAAPVAMKVRPRDGILVDLHEYHSRVLGPETYWHRRARPYIEWIIRTYVAKADAWTTVGPGLAEEYEREFGFRSEVVRNTTPFHDRAVQETAWPPRLVHSGIAASRRKLEWMIDGVAQATNGATLDMYLVQSDEKYFAELEQRAAGTGGRVRVLPPVPYSELMSTVARYDVGISVLGTGTFNLMWSLPNKLFDFIQGRLATIVGPSPEMARFVQETGHGVVTEDFTPASIAATIDALTKEQIDAYKRIADANARRLSAEVENEGWLRALRGISERAAARRAKPRGGR
ncbi:glycosyltransferase [Microbacterium sp. MC2]